jgi:hypothetical protein
MDGTHTFTGSGLYQGTPSQSQTTYLVTSLPIDLIFRDDFESGDLSAWAACVTDAGDLSVTNAAALVGNYGLQALLDDNNAIYCTDNTPNAEPRYRARFYFDPNSISMVSGDSHRIFYGYNGTSKVVLRVEFRRSSGNYQLRAGILTDGSSWNNSSWFTITDASHSVEFDWRAATAAGANDGGLTLWIDGTQKANLIGVDNDTWRIDQVRLGAVASIDSGTRGTYYFDAFESRRQSYIGSVPPNSTAPDIGPTPMPAIEAIPTEVVTPSDSTTEETVEEGDPN